LIRLLNQKLDSYTPRLLELEYPHAGILVPVTDKEGDPHLIFTLRSGNLKTHRGQVAFPGGKKDPEDENLRVTALRETHEEIGLPADHIQIAGQLSQVVSLHGIIVTPFVGLVPHDYPLTANPDEIESIFTVPLQFFIDDRRDRTDRLTFLNTTIHVPSYVWEDYRIWGLSAIVLVDFLNAVYDAGIDITQPPKGK